MQKITPFLWFNTEAEEAMNFYTTIFKNSEKGPIRRYGKAGPGPEGSVMTCSFTLDGVEFMALNGGPVFDFSPAISLFIRCNTQEEVDFFWEKLSEGGSKSQCGWLKDKYGVSWQVVPDALGELMYDNDPQRSQRVMQAMMQMTKIDIKALQAAYNG